MNIVEQNDERLVLRDLPILYWINAPLFIAVGVLLAWFEQAFRMGMVLAVLGVIMAVVPAIRTVVLERSAAHVVIWRRNLYWKRKQEIPFSQIHGVEVYTPSRMKNLEVLNLVLTGDRRLTLADGGRSSGFAQIAEVMRAYLQNS